MHREEDGDILKTEFENHMGEKYGEKFVFLELEGSHFGSPERAAYVSCKRYPNDRIWVKQTIDDAGNKVFIDNYMAYYYADQISKLLDEATMALYPNCTITYKPSLTVIPETASSEMTIDEMLKNKETLLTVKVIIHDVQSLDQRELNLELWRQELKKRFLRVKGTLNCADNEKICYVAMDAAYEYFYAEWR